MRHLFHHLLRSLATIIFLVVIGQTAKSQSCPRIQASSTLICPGDTVTLTAQGASGYQWNSIPASNPVDGIPSVVMAVGLRKLRTDYNGPAILLRRSSDNQTRDIGFAGNDLDTTDVINFLNGATGYCVKLYDQSGSAVPNNMEQADPAKQPVLILNGVNQRPILRFSTSQYLQNVLNPGAHYSIVYAAKQNGPSRQRVLSSISNNWLLGWWNGMKGRAFFGDWVATDTTHSNSDPYIYSCTNNGAIAKVYENGIEIASSTTALLSPAGIRMNGSGMFNEQSDCDFFDVIIISDELSTANRNSIENNINYYYGVYTRSLGNNNPLLVTPPNSTRYILSTNDPNCAPDTLLIQVHQTPLVSIIASANSICNTNTDTVTLTANAGVSYLWNTGEHTQSIQTTEPGTYTVTITYETGCTRNGSFTIAGLLTPTLDHSGEWQIYSCGSFRINVTNYPPGTLGFTWYKNGQQIIGANGSSCLVTGIGSYKVVKNDGECFSKISDSVTVAYNNNDPLQQTGILYVNANATGNNTGRSWADAYTDLQTALQYDCNLVTQIWVAKGTYKPTLINDYTASFNMRNNLKILGGFNGTETNSNQRNWQLNETILSGEIGDPNSPDDNIMNLVYNINLDSTAVLDGFTITKAGDDLGDFYQGGGVHNQASNVSIYNCRFVNNLATGGVIYNDAASSPRIINCEFTNNFLYSYVGGAIYNASLTQTLIDHCSFINNNANAIFNRWGGSFKVVNSQFKENHSNSGSAIFTYGSNLGVDIINCSFIGNVGETAGGIIFVSDWDGVAPVNIVNCSFSGNDLGQSNHQGVITTGLYHGSLLNVTNCIFWGNNGPAVYDNEYTNPTVITYSDIQGGHAGTGNLNVDPLFVDQPPIGQGTVGDLRLQPASPVMNKGIDSVNHIALDLAGNPRIADTIDMGAYEIPIYTYYRDNDHDNYGNPLDSIRAAVQPTGYVIDKTDCDDADSTVHPGAIEICDGKDNNCDGRIDEGFTNITYYRDADGDGYGNPLVTITAKCNPPAGYVTNNTDCNDNDSTKWRSAMLYVDADGDGYTVGAAVSVCYGTNIPAGYKATSLGTDCNDNDAGKWRSAMLYVDADGDGYTVGSAVSICYGANIPPGYRATSLGADCNDNDAGVHQPIRYYQDADGDGYGVDNNKSILVCSSVAPAGYSPFNTDCNDKNATIYPGAPELCDGIDNNCDGQIDENCPQPGISINDVSILEGNTGKKTLTFDVTLSQSSTRTVTVNYVTVNGTATAPSDYTAKSGTLTFRAGVTTQQVTISINGDKTPEPDETFTVVLSNPANGVINKGTGTGTILNDDGGTFSPEPGSMSFNSSASSTPDATALPGANLFDVKVFNNPGTSGSEFILQLQTAGSENVQIIATDMLGKKVLVLQGAVKNTYRFGANWISGTYFIQVIQGKNAKTVKLIKG